MAESAAPAPVAPEQADNTPAPSPSLYIKNLNEKIKLDGTSCFL